jgi:hypothetical protein
MTPVYDVITEAEIFIRARLLASSAVTAVFSTRVFTNPGPRYNPDHTPVTYPILTYEFLYPTGDLILVGADRLWSSLRFLVRGIAEGNDSLGVGAGAAAIYNALHATSGYTANGAVISSCIHDRPYKEVEVLSSTQYIHVGGEYLIDINTPTD